MVETDGPDKAQAEESQVEEAETAASADAPEGDAPQTPRAPSSDDGAMIRSPSQELAAIPDEEATEPEPEPDWEAQHEKTRNQLLRVAADFENFKKRTKRDLQDAANRARDDVLQELLPVIDNLERAIDHADAAAECVDAATLLEGVRMVLRQFESSMERFQVKGFNSVGEPFDPTYHEALQKRETDEVPPGHVVEEFRKGYMMGDRLVRPAMVVVAAAPSGNGKDENTEAEGEPAPEASEETDAAAAPGDSKGD